MRSSVRCTPLAVAAVAVLLGSLALSAGRASGAPPTFGQGTAHQLRSGSVNSTSFSAATSPGDLLVAFVVWDNTSIVGLTDTLGNAWVAATPRQSWNAGQWSSQTFYAPVGRGGADTVSATFTKAIASFGDVSLAEYRGLAGSAPVDTATALQGTGSVMSTPTATTTKAGDLLFAGGASDKRITAVGSGFTARSTAFGTLTADRAAPTAGSYAATATQNGKAWVLQLVAFKAASPSTTTTTIQATTTTTSTTSTTSTTTSTTTTTPMPGMGQPDHCMFTSFCDAFQTIKAGGRAGDLDETKWSAARVTQFNNPAQGDINKYVPFTPEFCMDHNAPPRLADNDSFICGQQFGESNHWMEGMNDAGQYVVSSFRPVQPFDFAGRTSTLDFSVDAKTAGPHSAWIEAWLTADPQQAPHEDFPGTHTFPRQGVEFRFDADWCGALTGNALRQVAEYNGYVLTADHSSQTPCFTTADDTANHFQLRVSQNRIEVWVSDAGGANFKFRYGVDVNLPFTRGYWNLQHVQYNADKFGSGMQTTTYHWHAVSFDGPVLPADGSYQVPDALSKTPLGNMNLGYQTPTAPFTLTGVDPTGTAYLTFNVYWFQSPATLNLNVNGHTVQAADPTPDLAAHRYQWHFLTVPVPAADLVAGSNTVQISNNGCGDQCPTVANVDLEVVRR